MTPKIISKLAKQGLYFTVEEQEIRVDGFLNLDKDRRKKAIKYFDDNKRLLFVLMQVVDVFKVDIPGYCPNCPAAVWDWPRIYRKKIHRRWCVYKPYFEGKAARPVLISKARQACPRLKLMED